MGNVIQTIVDLIVKAVDPEKIILFGSRSYGNKRPESDFDILVLKKGQYHRRALAQKIYRELVDLPVSVDVIVETPEKAERYRKMPGFIYAEAMKGRTVYER